VKLPRLFVLTDRGIAGRPLVDVVDEALDGGALCIVFREKDLPRYERRLLGEQIAERVHESSALFIVASDADLASELQADAVHLSASDARKGTLAFGRSCHHADDVVQAAAEGATYATLSPIFATSSKPGYGPALGTQVLVGGSLPVYALGGVREENASACMVAGAAGVAVMGEVMRAVNPSAQVEALLKMIQ
jgi:thiamine-phosphate pyrophosphorylase